MSSKILIVEDNLAVALAIKQALKSSYEVDIAHTGRSALKLARDTQYQSIVLDLTLPDLNGFDVCKALRRAGNTVPIIIVSGEAAITSKIALLDAGADDYLIKPFDLNELKARLRVMVRRTRLTRSLGSNLTLCGVALESTKHTVERDGIPIMLRPKEFSLLECLMNNGGHVVSRAVLLQYAWEDTADVWTNVVDVHIKYLRDKLDHPFARPLLKTVHGLGYKFDISSIANTMKGGKGNERAITDRPY